MCSVLNKQETQFRVIFMFCADDGVNFKRLGGADAMWVLQAEIQ